MRCCCCYIYCSFDEIEKEKDNSPTLNSTFLSKTTSLQVSMNGTPASDSSTPFNETISKKKRPKRKHMNRSDIVTVWRILYPESFEGKCKLCREKDVIMAKSETWEISHVQAFAEGGKDSEDNLRPLCRTCNRSMGKNSIQEYCKKKFPNEYKEILEGLKIKE